MSRESRIEQSDPVAIVYAFRPNFTDTLVTVALVSGTGSRCHRDTLWRGRLPVSRDTLRGLSPRECALLLGDELHGYWQRDLAANEEPIAAPAGLLGAPLGATGGTVTNDPLPGL